MPSLTDKISTDTLLVYMGAALAILFAIPYGIPDYPHAVTPFLLIYFCAFVAWGFAVWKIIYSEDEISSRTIWIIIGFAILFRAIVLPQESILDDDLYRYIWDGKIWLSGVNPYSFAPSSASLSEYRDANIHPYINFPYIPTIYPPMAQFVFATSFSVFGDSLVGMKLMFTIFDIATIFASIGLLKAVGMKPVRVIIYAWCPLVIKEIAGSGHMDSLAVLLIVFTVWLAGKRPYLASISLGAAIAAKLYPIVLLPLLVSRLRWSLILVPFVVALAYVPFLSEPFEKIFSGFLAYGQYWVFNPGVFDLLRKTLSTFVSDGAAMAKIISMIAVIAFVAWRMVRQESGISGLIKSVMWTLAILLFLAPTVDPWYLVCLIPFLCVFPSPALLLWMGLSFLSYTFYYGHNDIAWVRALEYVAIFIVLFWETVFRAGAKKVSIEG